MQTILISGGRKDKLRPGDILGALTGDAGGLRGEDIGKIEIHDRLSYVAVTSHLSRRARNPSASPSNVAVPIVYIQPSDCRFSESGSLRWRSMRSRSWKVSSNAPDDACRAKTPSTQASSPGHG